MEARALILGIAGGSGSGKTTTAARLLAALGEDRAVGLCQDSYYRDPPAGCADPAARNYDEPAALDEVLLARHLRELRAGRPVRAPVYDFERHRRRPETVIIAARPVVVVEGILLLASAPVRKLLDLRVFVEAEADLRLARRLRRDVRERGRTEASVRAQWEATVLPMHAAHVEPSRRHAHVLLPGSGSLSEGLEVLLGHLRDHLRSRGKPSEILPSDLLDDRATP